MTVEDFDGTWPVQDEAELLTRLRTSRRGLDGAFVLGHPGEEGSLYIHINGDIAWVCYIPDTEAGSEMLVPDGMWTAGKQSLVRFLMTTGYEGDAIYPPPEQWVPLETVYQAAVEFLHSPHPPQSINWIVL